MTLPRSKTTILKETDYQKPALRLAPCLLGKFLVRQTVRGKVSGMITEVEAYLGKADLASHASKGRTTRTEAMFAAGGVWYVYMVYGMYWMLNIVVDRKDEAAAILIRAVGGTSGPGRVAGKFGINKNFYGKPSSKKSGLWIEDRGVIIPKNKVKKSSRIGIDYAGPIWSKKHYRFYIKE